jgi:Uma2 family endonuclease
MATRVVLTYADYAALPADGRRYELHEGELFVTAAPRPRHQEIVGNLYVLLGHHVRRHHLGKVFLSPIDVILADITVVQPDLVYLDAGRLELVSERGIEGAPSLVVEVQSPSTVSVDRGVKLQLYARYGVSRYWVADPDTRVIESYLLAGRAYEAGPRLEDATPLALPPFLDLPLDPADVWR